MKAVLKAILAVLLLSSFAAAVDSSAYLQSAYSAQYEGSWSATGMSMSMVVSGDRAPGGNQGGPRLTLSIYDWMTGRSLYAEGMLPSGSVVAGANSVSVNVPDLRALAPEFIYLYEDGFPGPLPVKCTFKATSLWAYTSNGKNTNRYLGPDGNTLVSIDNSRYSTSSAELEGIVAGLDAPDSLYQSYISNGRQHYNGSLLAAVALTGQSQILRQQYINVNFSSAANDRAFWIQASAPFEGGTGHLTLSVYLNNEFGGRYLYADADVPASLFEPRRDSLSFKIPDIHALPNVWLAQDGFDGLVPLELTVSATQGYETIYSGSSTYRRRQGDSSFSFERMDGTTISYPAVASGIIGDVTVMMEPQYTWGNLWTSNFRDHLVAHAAPDTGNVPPVNWPPENNNLDLPCYTITDLGDFYSDDNNPRRLAINGHGTVTGPTTRWDWPTESGFVFKDGTISRLPTLGGASAEPRAINSRGQIGGTAQAADGTWRGVIWNNGEPSEFPIGVLALNEKGDAAGGDQNGAAAWIDGRIVEMPIAGETASWALGINNRGDVCGGMIDPDGSMRGFEYRQGELRALASDFGVLVTNAINNQGVVCGSALFENSWNQSVSWYGYLYQDGEFKTKFLGPDVWWSSCNGINDQGQVVGDYQDAGGSGAFLWRNADEGVVRLNERLPLDNDVFLDTAIDINTHSQVTAQGWYEGVRHGYLLSPIMCGKQCLTPPDGLIGWWSGDRNFDDIASGMSGTMFGNMRFFPAVVRKGFVLDGYHDYIQVADAPPMHAVTTAVTISAWINPQMPTPPSGEGYGEGWIFAARDPLTSEGFSFYLNSDGFLIAALQADTSVGSAAWLGVPLLFDGTWKHVTMTADTQTGAVTYYLNGQQIYVEYPAGFSGRFADIHSFLIGHRQPPDTSEGQEMALPFKGMIDEVQVFNRVLSGQEIQAIYQAGTQGVCKK